MSKTLQNAEQKQQDIVIAAEALFLQQGYGVSSMDQIAQEAGVTKQTVYRYFPSKNELFGAVMQRMRTAEAETWRFGAGAIAEELSGFAAYLLGLHLQPQALGLYRILLTEAAQEGLLATFKSQGPQQVLQPLIEYLGKQTQLEDPAFCAQMFATMILAPRNQMLMSNAQVMKKSVQQEHVRKVTTLFMKMIEV
jgi:TetR/AcrR family transcriptional regulator, mexJK operon transcriptional repressor